VGDIGEADISGLRLIVREEKTTLHYQRQVTNVGYVIEFNITWHLDCLFVLSFEAEFLFSMLLEPPKISHYSRQSLIIIADSSIIFLGQFCTILGT
jgi:hypothetical protein